MLTAGMGIKILRCDMSIFNNPDFLVLKPLDLENKLFLPTTKLYSQTVWRLNTLYQDIKAALANFYGYVTTQGQQFYEHPVDTTTAWYGQTVDFGTRVYAMSDRLLPKAEAIYQDTVAGVVELGHQTSTFWQAFYENPEAFTASLIAPVTAKINSLVGVSLDSINASIDATGAYLMSLYAAMVDLFKLLLDQPGATLTALYQNTLALLLDSYYELVTSLLNFTMA